MKKIFAFMLVLSMFAYCKPTVNENTEEEGQEGQEQEGQGEEKPKPTEVNLDELLATYQTQDDVLKNPLSEDKLPAEIHDGDEVLATNPNVEKFLTEVTYVDKDYKTTHVLEYYGGFNGKKYNENGELDENGTVVTKPVSDIPSKYSIRWTADESLGQLKFELSEEDWHYTRRVHGGYGYVIISNLVPNVTYTYSLTKVEGGDVVTQGHFTTTGHLHQAFFDTEVRNCRDLGGWKTLDGKTVKYHKIYRGGRLQGSTLSASGKKELLAEGIRAQLDLRGKSDVLKAPVFKGLAFCAPSIEQGGNAMLNEDKAKTKECFEFVVNCLRENKPVYFHCSLGRDRTGTFGILLLGTLGVPQCDIAKEYEVTYFSGHGWAIALSEQENVPDDEKIFQNTLDKWVFSEVAPSFWQRAGKDGTFADGCKKYLTNVAKVSQQDIDDYCRLMLSD